MSLSSRLDNLHARIRRNRWYRYFAVFNRIALAAGFIPSGMQKVLGERFTDLSVNHPLGNYLEAFWHTEYYYTFVGIMQVTTAVLLLIPRTATLGAMVYFPIILNIFVLSIAVRFDGSFITAPLMVLANLYLLAWDYDKLKYALPFRNSSPGAVTCNEPEDNRFPTLFFAGVAATVAVVILTFVYGYSIMPRNRFEDCMAQCEGRPDSVDCYQFCDCIHNQGNPLGDCLEEYEGE